MASTVSIKFNCPGCSHPLSAPAATAGLQAKCGKCGRVVTVPLPVLKGERKIGDIKVPHPLIVIPASILLVFGLVYWLVNREPSTDAALERAYRRQMRNEGFATQNANSDAVYVAQDFVRSRLGSVASFGAVGEHRVTQAGSEWHVVGYADMPNQFGATARKRWTVVMERSGDQWKLKDVAIAR